MRIDYSESINKMAEILVGSDNIVILSHTGPDGDAVGSVSALLLALRKMGKNVCAVLETLPRKFSTIEGAELIEFKTRDASKYKTVVALDCADKARLGKFESFFDGAELSINIDHHLSNDLYGMYNCVDSNASAASELLYRLMSADKRFEIDKRIASALYAGILYDTGGFRHANTTAYTYHAAGELISFGVDFSEIYKRMFRLMRFEEAKILIRAFDNMKQEAEGKVVWTSITSAEMEQAEANAGDLDNIVDYCKSVEGAEIAAFIYQKGKKEFKVSLRSEKGYDVSLIAAKFGGGGHKNAAGATLCGELEECAERLLNEIRGAI